MKCPQCNKDNRERARFCRFCGYAIAPSAAAGTADDTGSDTQNIDVPDALEAMVALQNEKNTLREFVDTIKTLRSQRGKAALANVNMNILITGPTGTGKSMFAKCIKEYLEEEQVVKKHEPCIFYPYTIEDFDNLANYNGKVIIFEEIDSFLSDDDGSVVAAAPLFTDMRQNLRSADTSVIVIVLGSPTAQEYFDSHPEAKSLFGLNFKLKEYTPVEVAEICEHELAERFNLLLEPEARAKLGRVFNYERRNSGESFGNGHLAVAKANEIVMAVTRRNHGQRAVMVVPDDITGREFVPKTLDEVMKEFDKYVGIDEVKASLRDIVNTITSARLRDPDKPYVMSDHFRFVGNPGTGKTTMARLYADALNALGILPSGQLIEVSRKDLIGQYVGSTAKLVDHAFDRAMGGVLFVDEAYSLWQGEGDSFGSEAVATLIKNVEDRRGQLVVILAGYSKEMDEFATANSGIASRFNETIHFRDYNGAELTEIARRMIASKGYTLDESAKAQIEQFFNKMYISRDRNFGNARDVRNAVDKAIKNHSTRIAGRGTEGYDATEETVISMSDFTGTNEQKPKTVDEVLASLDDLVGMDDIKEEIRKIANTAVVNRLRIESGLGAASLQPINIVLTGNPGTGKTTIAKRLGEVFKAAGVLPTDKVVEREKKTLLDSYVNSAGINMNKAVDEAMGGVLFIDEAYNLLPEFGSMNNSGNEALDALMTRMENDKGKFVVVIAGYRDRMERLMTEGNPGLTSRFNKRFHIEDYTPGQLAEIILNAAAKLKLTFTDDARRALFARTRDMVALKGPHFGNARDAIALLNRVVEVQSNRLAANLDSVKSNPKALFTIEASDLTPD